jgi:hypothetical protein
MDCPSGKPEAYRFHSKPFLFVYPVPGHFKRIKYIMKMDNDAWFNYRQNFKENIIYITANFRNMGGVDK